MSVPVLLALTGSSLESVVVQALQPSGSAGVVVVRRCVDLADLAATAATGQARAALIAGDLPHLDADVVDALRSASVEPLGIVAVDDLSARHRLHQIGIAVVLTVGSGTDLAGQVVAGLAHRRDATPEEPPPAGRETEAEPADVVAVWGPTGAPGRTTVALGLASELARLGRRTLLVDADVYGGTVAQHLGLLEESSGLLAAARSAKVGALDATALARLCRRVGELLVLTGLPRPDRWPELSPVAAAGVLTAARALADVVVVDCGFSIEADEELMFDTAAPRRNGATLRLLDLADRVLVVGAADPVGLGRLARGVVDLTAAIPGCEPMVVVNRMRSGLGWSAAEATATIQRFTGRAPAGVLPDDPAGCDRALVHGRTLAECAPRSALRSALQVLATDLSEDLSGVLPTGRTRRGRRRRAARAPARTFS